MSTSTVYSASKIEIEIDASNPLGTGTAIAHLLVMPFMNSAEADLPQHVDRVQLWTGLFAATLGMMAASVGPDDSEAAYLALRGAFDQVRSIQAMQAIEPAKGVH